MKFVAGVVVGIVIATIGITGVINLADQGVRKVQEISVQANEKP